MHRTTHNGRSSIPPWLGHNSYELPLSALRLLVAGLGSRIGSLEWSVLDIHCVSLPGSIKSDGHFTSPTSELTILNPNSDGHWVLKGSIDRIGHPTPIYMSTDTHHDTSSHLTISARAKSWQSF